MCFVTNYDANVLLIFKNANGYHFFLQFYLPPHRSFNIIGDCFLIKNNTYYEKCNDGQ